LAKLICNNYGFECDFVSEGEIEKVIEEFKDHTENEHGIDYSKEALMHFILRQNTWYANGLMCFDWNFWY